MKYDAHHEISFTKLNAILRKYRIEIRNFYSIKLEILPFIGIIISLIFICDSSINLYYSKFKERLIIFFFGIFSVRSDFLVKVRAQVMSRDESTEGWLPLAGGGLANVSIRKRARLPPEVGGHEYIIYGQRISDQTVSEIEFPYTLLFIEKHSMRIYI